MDIINQEVKSRRGYFLSGGEASNSGQGPSATIWSRNQSTESGCKKNAERFPESFMFKLTTDEFYGLVTICDRFELFKHSSVTPYAFTEQGVAMLSAVLRSATAVSVSIKIIESFVRMRQFLAINSNLFHKIGTLETRITETEAQVKSIMKMIDNYIDDNLHHRQLSSDGELPAVF